RGLYADKQPAAGCTQQAVLPSRSPNTVSIPNPDFKSSIPSLYVPLSTLNHYPHEQQPMT
ncbi:hypothetical protein, partial [Desulfobotulus alkaliphilus]|uniref:hypothetical protein n=1 Tax=Desulfobotulus alkaliphilus TaxID=622671 RepID=UPI001C97CE2B